jgi:hypothetical protein
LRSRVKDDSIRFAALKTTVSGLSVQKAGKDLSADLEGCTMQLSRFAETARKETQTDEYALLFLLCAGAGGQEEKKESKKAK